MFKKAVMIVMLVVCVGFVGTICSRMMERTKAAEENGNCVIFTFMDGETVMIHDGR